MNSSGTQYRLYRLPNRREIKFAYLLSLVIALLMGAASVAGLLFSADIYPTDELLDAFLPNDVTNIAVGLPILLGSMWLTRRGRLIGLLFWPGALFYILYTYLVYLLGMPLNGMFLLYLALVTLSVYGMIGLVASIDGDSVKQRLTGVVPERSAGGILAAFGMLFMLRAIAVIAGGVINATPTGIVERALLAADFLFAPALVAGGMLLWQRKALGYVAGTGLLFQTSMLFVGLIAILILQPMLTGVDFSPIDVLVIAIMGMICFIPLALTLRGIVSSHGSEARVNT